MGKVLNVLFLALFITIVHGLPQHRDTDDKSKSHVHPQISNFPAKLDLKHKDTASHNGDHNRKTRDTEQQPKPLDRSQISTLPATVDFKKQDTVPQKDDQHRNTRDTVQQPKPLDRSQISTLPATVDLKKQDTVPNYGNYGSSTSRDLNQQPHPAYSASAAAGTYSQKSSTQSNYRQKRGAENSKHGDIESNSHRQNSQSQTHQSRDSNRPSHLSASNPHLAPPPNGHSTKDVHRTPGVQPHAPTHH